MAIIAIMAIMAIIIMAINNGKTQTGNYI